MDNLNSRNLLGNSRNAGRSNTAMIIGIVAIIVIIIIVIVLIARNNNNSKAMVIGNHVEMFSFPKDKVFELQNSDDGLECTYSFWMYVHNWNYRRGEWKNVFVKGDADESQGSNRAPGVWLYPESNDLHIRFNTYANPNEGCDVRNIPLQKWVNVVIVLNNRSVDTYVDGKLERSCVLMGVPKLNENDLHVGVNGGYMGKLSKLQYFKNALNPDDVYGLYVKGPYL